jgi:hypothetical protein
MSHVADIIFTTAIEDGAETDGAHPNTDKLSAYIEKNHSGATLVKVDSHAGGSKAMQCDVFMAAINYMDIDAFVAWFQGIEWEYPESVQLLIKDEHEDLFTVYVPKI